MASSTSAAATRRLVPHLSLISRLAVATCIHTQGEPHEPSTGDLSPLLPSPLGWRRGQG